jgi:TRAP-type C4-dicarboxylate transport system substrate-binding protein
MNTYNLTATSVLALSVLVTGVSAETLTLAHHNAVGSQISNRGEALVACVDEADVDLYIQHLPASQLGTASEVIEQVLLSAVDMSITDTAYLSELEPELAAFQLPFMFEDWDHAERAMQGDAGNLVRNTLSEERNMTVLAFMHNGFRDLLTTDTPVRSLVDMQQVQFRSPPLPLWLRMFEALEVQPVTVPWNDVYTAMQTGLVEGLETTPEGMVSSGVYEVGNYVTLTGHMYNLTTLVGSIAALKRLNGEQLAALESCADTFQLEGNAEVRALADSSLDTLREAGIEIIDIDKTPFQDRLRPAWSDLAGESPEVLALIAAITAAQ